jgi:hypothetical protein
MKRRFPEAGWIVGALGVLGLITFIDGVAVARAFAQSQWLSTALVWFWWILLFRHVGRRLRIAITIGVVMATAGELFFCKLVGMYEYRLGNIPFYVPPGHSVLYATIHLFCRQPWVRRHVTALTWALAAVACAYSASWLVIRHDVFGFGCFCGMAALTLLVPQSRLFFVAMYLLVALLELSGTFWACWRWQPTLLGHWTTIPSANPPSGVALFYVLYDLSCLGMYFFVRWASFERWVGRRVLQSSVRAATLRRTA